MSNTEHPKHEQTSGRDVASELETEQSGAAKAQPPEAQVGSETLGELLEEHSAADGTVFQSQTTASNVAEALRSDGVPRVVAGTMRFVKGGSVRRSSQLYK